MFSFFVVNSVLSCYEFNKHLVEVEMGALVFTVYRVTNQIKTDTINAGLQFTN